MSEQLVDILSKFYSVRRSLKIIFHDFDRRCNEWQEVIRKVAKEKDMPEIQAVIDIMTRLEGKEAAQMWVMAAYVEMVEPSV